MHDFRRLRVWQVSRVFAVEIDTLTRGFPRRDRGVVGGQMRRQFLARSLEQTTWREPRPSAPTELIGLRAIHGAEMALDPRRFRANILLDTDGTFATRCNGSSTSPTTCTNCCSTSCWP